MEKRLGYIIYSSCIWGGGVVDVVWALLYIHINCTIFTLLNVKCRFFLAYCL